MHGQGSFSPNMFCQPIHNASAANFNFDDPTKSIKSDAINIPKSTSHSQLRNRSTTTAAAAATIMPQRVPCRARGIPGKHDASNAYIEIPPNVKHGALLTCSSPNCVMTGRLFQFCSVCQLPVSKANFSKRHGHGLTVSMTTYFSESALPTSTNKKTRSSTLEPDHRNTVFLPPNNRHDGWGDNKRSISMQERTRPTSVTSSRSSSNNASTNDAPQNASWSTTPTTTTSAAAATDKTVLATPEEIRWISLWKQRPRSCASLEEQKEWFQQVQECSGVSILNSSSDKQQRAAPVNKKTTTKIPSQISSSQGLLAKQPSSSSNRSSISVKAAATADSSPLDAYFKTKSSSSSTTSVTTRSSSFPCNVSLNTAALQQQQLNKPITMGVDRLLNAATAFGKISFPSNEIPKTTFETTSALLMNNNCSSNNNDALSSYRQKMAFQNMMSNNNNYTPVIFESNDESCLMARDELTDIQDIWDDDDEKDDNDDSSMSDFSIATNKQEEASWMPISNDVFN